MHELTTKYPRAAAIIGAVVLFFIAGMLVTTIAANYHNNTTERAAEPATTATKTVAKNQTVYRVPKACKTAIQLGNDLDEANAKLHRTSGYAVAYASEGQAAELNEATRTAERLTDDIHDIRADYAAAAAKCKK